MIYIYYSGRHRCGSGVVSKFAADLYPSSHVFSTDVNPTAISSTRATMDIVASASHLLFSDLFSAFFKPRPLFDVIIFNPPYVPTDADEYARSLRDRDISASWAGGNNGREVTDRFARQALKNFTYSDSSEYSNKCLLKLLYHYFHHLVAAVTAPRLANFYILFLCSQGRSCRIV